MDFKEFICYGHIIDQELFKEIQDNGRLEYIEKPTGGLWCSPIESSFGWKDWCEAEEFRMDTLNTWTKFELISPKILEINSLVDLINIGSKFGVVSKKYGGRIIIKFEKIRAEGYDGIFLSQRGNRECHLPSICDTDGMDIDLNSWDCECLLLFNLECVKITEKHKRED